MLYERDKRNEGKNSASKKRDEEKKLLLLYLLSLSLLSRLSREKEKKMKKKKKIKGVGPLVDAFNTFSFDREFSFFLDSFCFFFPIASRSPLLFFPPRRARARAYKDRAWPLPFLDRTPCPPAAWPGRERGARGRKRSDNLEDGSRSCVIGSILSSFFFFSLSFFSPNENKKAAAES